MINTMITFTVSGLWHGANWTFVVWGFLNGLYLVVGRETQQTRDSWFNAVPYWLRASTATIVTFSLTCVAWIFFRAENLTDAWYILTHLFSNLGYIKLLPTDLITERSFLFRLGLGGYEFWVAIMSLIVFHIIEWFSRKQTIYDFTRKWPTVLKWSFFYFLIFATLMFGEFNQQEFIYFQF
jgi:D-alanyl-lipoteichoic acid acyltransferase DltB (MBOAT superfamily)